MANAMHVEQQSARNLETEEEIELMWANNKQVETLKLGEVEKKKKAKALKFGDIENRKMEVFKKACQ